MKEISDKIIEDELINSRVDDPELAIDPHETEITRKIIKIFPHNVFDPKSPNYGNVAEIIGYYKLAKKIIKKYGLVN